MPHNTPLAVQVRITQIFKIFRMKLSIKLFTCVWFSALITGVVISSFLWRPSVALLQYFELSRACPIGSWHSWHARWSAAKCWSELMIEAVPRERERLPHVKLSCVVFKLSIDARTAMVPLTAYSVMVLFSGWWLWCVYCGLQVGTFARPWAWAITWDLFLLIAVLYYYLNIPALCMWLCNWCNDSSRIFLSSTGFGAFGAPWDLTNWKAPNRWFRNRHTC